MPCCFVCLMVVTVFVVASANECSSGLSEWFMPFGAGTTDSTDLTTNVFTLKAKFNVFGFRYPSSVMKISFGKGNSFGALRIFPKEGRNVPGSFELRVSRVPYVVTENSYVSRRVTKKYKELKVINKIMKEAYPCVDDKPFKAVAAYVGTYQCVQFGDSEDTFQVIITTDNVRTYAILIFHTLSANVKLQYGIINTIFPSKYRLTPDRVDLNDTLLADTNGIRSGVWTYDITDAVPQTPSPCGKTPNECIVTDFGMVGSYDGDQIPINTKRVLLSASRLPKPNPCNFKSVVNMNKKGKLRYLGVFVGIENNKFAREYALDKKAGLVMVKGLGIDGEQVISEFPHSWSHDGANITLTDTTTGYVLSSTTCSYQFEYKPEGHEPQIKVSLGSPYTDKTVGECGKYTANFLEGNFHKGERYFEGNV